MDEFNYQVRKALPKSKKDLKVDRTHGFHAVIMVIGWVVPPLAILVRFGVGFDFFLNILLTICGYIPGHAHKYYCQNIRNNKTAKRTPKWAIRAGLVKIKDPRAGRHQWAYRYDERIPGGSASYGGDADSLHSASWDGRGPEPERRSNRIKSKNGNNRHRFSPWDDIVDEDEVEGGRGLSRSESALAPVDSRRTPPEAPIDPLTNEQFYPTAGEQAPTVAPRKSKKKLGAGLLKNRSRYKQPFDTTDAVSSRTRASDGYQDEFEREINEGSRPVGNGGAAPARFDSFDQEGPEDAWASSRPANGVAGGYKQAQAQRLQPQKTGRAEENDGDLFEHSF
ncbi:UPF0057 family protein [Rhodotorula toruloides]|uniref:UPF0057 family protein n=1 Tax=Rhodotorula toruloides TaxID=5286 RepID=A0A511KH74_RHOTO|nr:UPF0057 family protein [Rhodotorula toruloides]